MQDPLVFGCMVGSSVRVKDYVDQVLEIYNQVNTPFPSQPFFVNEIHVHNFYFPRSGPDWNKNIQPHFFAVLRLCCHCFTLAW
jgi:hypothetical protein